MLFERIKFRYTFLICTLIFILVILIIGIFWCFLDIYLSFLSCTWCIFLFITSHTHNSQELFQLEHGVCANCQLDCHKLVEHIRPLSDVKRRQYIEKFAPRVARLKKL